MLRRQPREDQTNKPADTQTTQVNTPPAYTPSRSPEAVAAAPTTSAPLPSSSTSRAYTETEALARDIKDGNLSGFVGGGTMVTGETNFKSMLRVDGHLSGRVSSDDGTLIVSAGGQVDANVNVSVAIINGTVNGDVTAAKRIELGRVAKVIGNIQTPALVIEQGAIFEGSCRMIDARSDQETQRTQSTYASSSSYASNAYTASTAAATATTASESLDETESNTSDLADTDNDEEKDDETVS
jgi:cytoskeletal protein CcmA (bactofilin family)